MEFHVPCSAACLHAPSPIPVFAPPLYYVCLHDFGTGRGRPFPLSLYLRVQFSILIIWLFLLLISVCWIGKFPSSTAGHKDDGTSIRLDSTGK